MVDGLIDGEREDDGWASRKEKCKRQDPKLPRDDAAAAREDSGAADTKEADARTPANSDNVKRILSLKESRLWNKE